MSQPPKPKHACIIPTHERPQRCSNCYLCFSSSGAPAHQTSCKSKGLSPIRHSLTALVFTLVEKQLSRELGPEFSLLDHINNEMKEEWDQPKLDAEEVGEVERLMEYLMKEIRTPSQNQNEGYKANKEVEGFFAVLDFANALLLRYGRTPLEGVRQDMPTAEYAQNPLTDAGAVSHPSLQDLLLGDPPMMDYFPRNFTFESEAGMGWTDVMCLPQFPQECYSSLGESNNPAPLQGEPPMASSSKKARVHVEAVVPDVGVLPPQLGPTIERTGRACVECRTSLNSSPPNLPAAEHRLSPSRDAGTPVRQFIQKQRLKDGDIDMTDPQLQAAMDHEGRLGAGLPNETFKPGLQEICALSSSMRKLSTGVKSPVDGNGQQVGGTTDVEACRPKSCSVRRKSRGGYRLQAAESTACSNLAGDHEEAGQPLVDVQSISPLVGSHNHIRNSQIKVFWQRSFGSVAEVKWRDFWNQFPGTLDSNADPHDQVKEVLSSLELRNRFQDALGGYNEVSVWGINTAFPPGCSLLEYVNKAVGNDSSHLFTLPRLSQKFLHKEFVGRDAIAEQLTSHIVATPGLVCITAAGGAGKSTLALHVGAQLWEKKRITGGAYFVDMRAVRVTQDLCGRFCTALKLDIKERDADYIIAAVVDGLHRLTGPMKDNLLLLLVDNVEDALRTSELAATFMSMLAKILDNAHGVRLLLTSRQRLDNTSSDSSQSMLTVPCAYFELSALEPQASASLVTAITKSDDGRGCTDAEAYEVADICHHSPLMLTLVATAIKGGRMSMRDVHDLSKLDVSGNNAVSQILATLPVNQKQRLAALSVFPINFDEASAALILKVDVASTLEWVEELEQYGLVLWDTAKHAWLLHPRVKDAASSLDSKAELERSQEAFIMYVLEALEGWNTTFHTDFRVAVQMARAREADISAAWSWLSTHPLWSPSFTSSVAATLPKSSELCLDGLWSHFNDDYLTTLQRLIPAAIQALPPDHSDTIACIHNLAICLERRSEYAKAQVAFHHELELLKRVPGCVLPDILACFGGIVECLTRQGNYVEAEAVLRDKLDLLLEAHDSNHPIALACCSHIALCLAAQGREEEAEEQRHKMQQLLLRVQARQSPQTIADFDAIIHCHMNLNNFNEAETVLQDKLKLLMTTLGPDHLDTLKCFDAIIDCLIKQCKYQELETVLRNKLKLLTDARESRGSLHPDTLTCYEGIEHCLLHQGNWQEAEALLRDKLKLLTEERGPVHSSSLACHTKIVIALQSQGKLQEAEAELRDKLKLLMSARESNDSDIIYSLLHLGACRRGERCFAPIWDNNLIHEHRRLNDLAVGFGPLSNEELAKAEATIRKQLDSLMLSMGCDHSDTLATIHNLAQNLWAQSKFEEAEKYFRHELQSLMRIRGLDHPDTVLSMHNLTDNLDVEHKSVQLQKACQVQQSLQSPLPPWNDPHYHACCVRRKAFSLIAQGKIQEASAILTWSRARRRS